MKILTLSDCPLVRHQGSGYVILGFHDQLKARGWQIDLRGPESLLLPRRFGTKGKRFRITLGMARSALCAHRSRAADLILAYGEECWLAFRLLSRRAGRPRLVHHSNGLRAHVAMWLGGPPRAWWDPSTDSAITQADHVVVVSEFERRFALGQYNLPLDRITSITNPTEPVAPSGTPIRRREVLFVGAWLERKGIHEILEVLPEFLDGHPEWSFRVVGTDDVRAVRDLFPASLRDRIHVEGVLRDKPDMAHRMASAALLVLPSRYESYGLVIAEAILQGAIPVVTRVGLGYELSDGMSGFVFDPMNPTALRDALERAVAAEAEWPAIASRGFELVSDRTWERAGQQMDELLRRVCKEGTG